MTKEDFKAKLFAAVQSAAIRAEPTQTKIAAKLGISQPRVSNLCNGHEDKFSIDMLIALAEKLEMRFDISIK